MPERATVFNVSQIGLESSYGVAVAPTKLLQAATIALDPKTDVQMFAPGGAKYDTSAAMSREWVEGKLSGGISYQEVIYWLASNLGDPGAPAVSGSEYTWTFLPKQSNPDNGKSYTIQQGGGPRNHQAAGLMLPDLNFKFTRQSAELDATILAKALQDGIYMATSEVQTLTKGGTWSAGRFTLTLGGVTSGWIAYNATATGVETGNGTTGTPYVTIQAALDAMASIGAGNSVVSGGPINTTMVTIQFTGSLGAQNVAALTYDLSQVTGSTPTLAVAEATPGAAPTVLPLQPVAVPHVTVAWADSYADLVAGSGTYVQLTRPFTLDWGLTGRYKPVWVLDGTTTFAAIVEDRPKLALKLKVEADAQGMSLLSTLRTNGTKYIRTKCQGPTITSNPFLLQLDTACRVTDVGSFSNQDGVYAQDFTLGGIFDSGIGSALKATVRNTLASL